MSGSITNDTILRAKNQTIKAINDLGVIMSECCRQMHITDMGTQEGLDEGAQEGGPAPNGDFGVIDVEVYADRKCKVCNKLIDDILTILTELEKYDVQQMVTVVGLGVVVGVITTVVAAAAIFLTGPLGFAFAVVGVLAGIVITYVGSTIEIDELISIITTNRQGLICILYQSVEPQGAIDEFCDALEGYGASSTDTALIRAMFTVYAAQFLYHEYLGDGGAWEQSIENYTPSTPCTSCGVDYWVAWGEDLGDGLINSVSQGAQHVISVVLNGVGWLPGQRSQLTVSIESGNIETTDDLGYRLYGTSSGDIDLFYSDNDAPSWPVCLRGADFTNDLDGTGYPFQIQITKGADC